VGSTRTWLLLVVVQIGLLALLAAVGPTVSGTSPLRYVGLACAAGVFVCVPPLIVKPFVASHAASAGGCAPKGCRPRCSPTTSDPRRRACPDCC
jgi:hypothetical protein